ncbi:TonB-dependent receptor [Aquimarina agarilytica]|uniref:TonB-dependent receptor n=1 Tax=Aquimarina agarilytica TaxID=1087449 RepID=UPI000287DA41|nr:TonB-dependent receptor [Aquimarina agarilytica]
MRYFKPFLIFIFSYFYGFSQNSNLTLKVPLEDALLHFQKEASLKFSYDPELIHNIDVKISNKLTNISIEQLAQLVKKQTIYKLQKIDNTNYILIKNNSPITICGTVVDQSSNFELAQTTIFKNNRAVSLTNKHGFFSIETIQTDSISIRYTGYTTKTILAKEFPSNLCDTIYLTPKVETLNDVIIDEYLTKGMYKKEDASIHISTKSLRILPGLVEPDVLQSAQLLPGVSSPTEDPASLFIRGGTPDQNLILWDGIKIYNTGHFFNQISTFNPYIIKNVEIYRGGTSVQYGDRISGAVIINSDDDVTERFKIGGGFNLTHADIYAKIPLSPKAGFLIAGRRSSTDIYDNILTKNLSQKVFQNTRAEITEEEELGQENNNREDILQFADTNFKFLWQPNTNNKITLSTIATQNILDNYREQQAENSSKTNITDQLKTQNFGASLIWRKKYTPKISQKFSVYTSQYNFDYNLFFKRINENFEFKNDLDNKVSDTGAEIDFNFKLGKSHSLHTGYQFTHNETDITIFNTFTGADDEEITDLFIKGKGSNHTFYNEYIYNFKKIYLRIGLRNSLLSNSNKSLFFEPRMFLSTPLSKNLQLTSSFELKNQQSIQVDTFASEFNETDAPPTLPNGDRLWILSGAKNDEILREFQIIKSRQVTLGLLYAKKGWHVDLEGYYKNLNDTSFTNNFLLTITSTADEFVTNSKEERWGVDFLLKKRIQNYRFWLSYTWSKTSVSIPSVQAKTFPNNFDQPHVLNISQTLKIKKLEFALGWNFASGRPFSNFSTNEFSGSLVEFNIDPKGFNAERLKNYHRLDASTTYRFSLDQKKKINGLIGFSIRNIYNQKNEIGQEFQLNFNDETGSILQSFNTASLQFTPDFLFRLNF